MSASPFQRALPAAPSTNVLPLAYRFIEPPKSRNGTEPEFIAGEPFELEVRQDHEIRGATFCRFDCEPPGENHPALPPPRHQKRMPLLLRQEES